MDGEVLTQGTELFFSDDQTSSVAAVVKMACPTGVTGLGGATSQINSTCLDDLVDEKYKPGLGQPATVTAPFILKTSGTGQVSHELLFTLKAAKTVLGWMVCLSEAATDPTLDSSDNLVAPAGRTSFAFDGYIADVNIDVAGNDIVRGTLLIQRTGAVTPYWNAA